MNNICRYCGRDTDDPFTKCTACRTERGGSETIRLLQARVAGLALELDHTKGTEKDLASECLFLHSKIADLEKRLERSRDKVDLTKDLLSEAVRQLCYPSQHWKETRALGFIRDYRALSENEPSECCVESGHAAPPDPED